jgi:hypothetical protein
MDLTDLEVVQFADQILELRHNLADLGFVAYTSLGEDRPVAYCCILIGLELCERLVARLLALEHQADE